MKDFNSVLYSLLGDAIRQRREEMKMSQGQLSEQMSQTHNLRRSSISNIERGRQQPPLHVLYEICRILKLDLHSILPTYTEIAVRVEKANRPAVDEFITSYDIDATTKEKLEEILKKSRK